MKKLWLMLAASVAGNLQATKFVITNNSSQDELPVLLLIYHENQNGNNCGKKFALLPHGKTTEVVSDKYKNRWGQTKECGVQSIDIVVQSKNGVQTSLFTATAEQLEAHGKRALSKQGKTLGFKSGGDRYTGYFVIDMDNFDIELK